MKEQFSISFVVYTRPDGESDNGPSDMGEEQKLTMWRFQYNPRITAGVG